jgi:acetate kinase
MKILVLNAGSSSIKFQLFNMNHEAVIASGAVERIGESTGRVKYTYKDSTARDWQEISQEEPFADHQQSLKKITELLMDTDVGVIKNATEIAAVGHRVVHGGEKFYTPTVITSELLKEVEKLSYLAPLHNPVNLKGIRVAMELFPDAPQVAVFDTAFHHTLPDYAYRYAIPRALYQEHSLRAYGFHGTSHQFVTRAAAKYLDIPLESFNAITIHLGNGCSMTAVKNGESVDTSMGLTPLGGLVMGTRSGDIDPSLIFFFGNQLGMSLSEIDQLLNKKSGLTGLTGFNDLRQVIAQYEAGDSEAILAINLYVYRIKKYIGAYMAVLGKLDAIVFTAGVGENSAFIREKVVTGLEHLNIVLDKERNDSTSRYIRAINTKASGITVLIVPTNEELEIANQVVRVLRR